ncbi:MAG TPA: alpha-glucan family phosphorylase [Gemmatimonadales bacterium]|nr:alpha-glucan family phosphorylase [Gemmatimonadales bacterium]
MPQPAAAAGAPGVPSAPAAPPTIAPPVPPSPPLPERISRLIDLSQNLWWSWQLDARELFHRIDHRLWEGTRHNAVEFLRQVEPERLEQRARDPAFLERYDAVMHRFAQLQDRSGTWFAGRFPELLNRPIAYFSAEFALHRSLPIYSGGLGVLAGDHCKEASDLSVPLAGVGLYYHGGYFDQLIGLDGWQRDSDDPIDPAVNPAARVNGPDGDPALVSLTISGREVQIGAWRVMVGRVPVYLLDTDLDRNDPADRKLTARLYTSAAEWRLKQEWVLGVGGVRMLRALGINPEIWHANEGHAAFMYIERLRELLATGLTLPAARNQIRSSSVFTTHTPVAAGHDVFTTEQVEQVSGPFWNAMGITREQFMTLGNSGPTDQRFEMTVLSLRLAGRVNGVSARHQEESRRIWRWVWDNRPAADIPIGHVTNGVHLGTWMARPIRELLAEVLGPDWESHTDPDRTVAAIRTLDGDRLWSAHEGLRYLLLHYIREEARHRWRDYWKDPAKLAAAGALLSPNVFTLGFARRFATYKRADLLFRDPERLRRLLTDSRRPVQIIFAGKAHPADDPGKRVLQRIFMAAQDPSFEGRIAFLEDYEMHLAQRMVAGVDMWVNLPRVPLEACGTSGMKAALNGVPHLSTLDGWWAEGFTGENGWAIPLPAAEADAEQSDMEQLFRLLEQEVVPTFYDRIPGKVSAAWLHMMKSALAVSVERFTTRQMLQTYVTRYYVPAAAGEALPGDAPL